MTKIAGSGSTIRRHGFPDPDLGSATLVLLSTSKIVKEALIPTVLEIPWIFFL
jgi:hypothetical protein